MKKHDIVGYGILALLDVCVFWSVYGLSHDVIFTAVFTGFFLLIGFVGAFAFSMANKINKEIRAKDNIDREPKKLL